MWFTGVVSGSREAGSPDISIASVSLWITSSTHTNIACGLSGINLGEGVSYRVGRDRSHTVFWPRIVVLVRNTR